MKRILTLWVTLLLSILGATAQEMPTLSTGSTDADGFRPSRQDYTPRLDIQAPSTSPGDTRAALPLRRGNAGPDMASVATSNILGYLHNPYDCFASIYPNGSLVQRTDTIHKNFQVRAMGVIDGKLHGFGSDVSGKYLRYPVYFVIDMNTWKTEKWNVLTEEMGVEAWQVYPQSGVYVPKDNAFYGYADKYWVRYDVGTGKFTKLKEYTDYAPVMTYNRAMDMIVGLDYTTGKLYMVSKADGALSDLGTISQKCSYLGGFAYDMSSDSYLWFYHKSASNEVLYSIDANTLEMERLHKYTSNIPIIAMYVNEERQTYPKAPMAPKFAGSDFDKAALTGSVTYTMPTMLNDSTTFTGDVEYVLKLNRKQYKTGKSTAGATVTIPIGSDAALQEGYVNLDMYCTHGSTQEGSSAQDTIYVGNGIPVPPTNVRIDATNVRWDAVTEALCDAYIDPASLTYDVYLDGARIAEGVKGTSHAHGIAADGELSLHTAEVVALSHGHSSKPGVSETVGLGSAFSLPSVIPPTAGQLPFFHIVDANNDGTTFAWNSSKKIFAYNNRYISESNSDDWLFLPPIKVDDPDQLIEFHCDADASNPYNEASFEVLLCRDTVPGTQVLSIIDSIGLAKIILPYKGYFSAPSKGKYFIAIHAIGKPGFVDVNNFRITPIGSRRGPAKVSEVVPVTGDKGALNATVSFKMPTKTYAGDALGDIQLTAKLVSSVDTVEVSGRPGQTVSAKVVTEQGDNVIDIQVFGGELRGEDAFTVIFTGVDVPAKPEVWTVPYEDNQGFTIRWKAPTQGANGRYINPDEIQYQIYQKRITPQGLLDTSLGFIDGRYGGVNIDAASDNQKEMIFEVEAHNVAGKSSRSALIPFVGKLVETPAVENYYANEIVGLTYSPFVSGVNVKWQFYKRDAESTTSALDAKFLNTEAPVIYVATITNGKSAATASGATLKFDIKKQNKMTFTPNFYVQKGQKVRISCESRLHGEETIFELTDSSGYTEGYHDVPVLLPEKFQDDALARIRIYADLNGEQYPAFYMTGWRMENTADHDFGIMGIISSKVVSLGDSTSTIVKVRNFANKDVAYTGGHFFVTDTLGNVLADYIDQPGGVIPKGQTAQRTWKFSPDIELVGKRLIKFVLNKDEYAGNDTVVAECRFMKGVGSVVDDLAGVDNGGSIALHWTAPKMAETETFEAYTPFKRTGDRLGKFRHVSRNDTPCQSIGLFSRPAVAEMVKEIVNKSGFNVFDVDAFGVAIEEHVITSISGKNVAFVFSPANGTADDWLISPRVVPGSDVQLMASLIPYGSEKGEVLQICYSTEDTEDPDKFQPCYTHEFQDYGKGMTEWELLTCTLPENAVRMAIHYGSTEKYGLFIDDISYIPAEGATGVASYDVFRRSGSETTFTKVGNAPEAQFTDSHPKKKDFNRYYVVPQLANGSQGPRSNIVSILTSGVGDVNAVRSIEGGKGVITVTGYEGVQVDVYATDGKRVGGSVPAATETYRVPAGIYLVKAAGETTKVVVR